MQSHICMALEKGVGKADLAEARYFCRTRL